MKFNINKWNGNLYCLLLVVLMLACQNDDAPIVDDEQSAPQDEVLADDTDSTQVDQENDEDTDHSIVPTIDLSHWKVTLPIAENGKTIEVEPPEILDYTNNEMLKEFMYEDTEDGSLVFYTYPDASTANSSYSRTELREQMVAGSNSTNWTFSEGGRMKGTLSVPFISKDSNNEFHRTIVMQIHGRLTNEQRDRIGENDNNAPPILKIYWQKGNIRVLTKELKDSSASGDSILSADAWDNDDGHTFSQRVDSDKFTLEIIASNQRLEVILNEEESVVYDDIHIQKWGAFENYFKAGNYLQTTDVGSSAIVKYYNLEVTH